MGRHVLILVNSGWKWVRRVDVHLFCSGGIVVVVIKNGELLACFRLK